jgi:hypothetical protein
MPSKCHALRDLGVQYLSPPREIGLWPIGLDPSYVPASGDTYYLIIAGMVSPGVIAYWPEEVRRGEEREHEYDPRAVDEFARQYLLPEWRQKKYPRGKALPLPGTQPGIPRNGLGGFARDCIEWLLKNVKPVIG